MLQKSVHILADDVVTVGRYENIFRDGFYKVEMEAQKMRLMITHKRARVETTFNSTKKKCMSK